MWICQQYYIKNNKLIVVAENIKTKKTKNATGPGINLNFDWLKKQDQFDKEFENILNKCLSSWDGESSIAELLKTALRETFNYNTIESTIDFENVDFLLETKQQNLHLKINEKVFEYYKDYFEIYDETHSELLYKGLQLYHLYSSDSYFSDITDKILFSGGTSLMYKYKDFYRFSKDLDFQLAMNISEADEYKIYDLFSRIKTALFDYIVSDQNYIVEDKSGIHKEIVFMGLDEKVRNIKIDFLAFPGIEKEVLKLKDFSINKLSDLDILCNKLLRLKEVDICDITFLILKHNFKKEEIIKTLKAKSLQSYGNEKEVFFSKAAKWKEVGKTDLPFLRTLI